MNKPYSKTKYLYSLFHCIMCKWQWNFYGRWYDCEEQNQKILRALHTEPSLEPICLTNAIGTISGYLGKLTFAIYDDNEKYITSIRRGPSSGEHPIYTINGKYIPYELTTSLFRNGKPFMKKSVAQIGIEQFTAHQGKIYQQIDGIDEEVKWVQTDISKLQLNTMLQTRLNWEFQGPMRADRMREAVTKTAEETNNQELLFLFEAFDPTLEATEHGPFQFPDFLNAHGKIPLSIAVMDNYYAQEPQEWKKFDPFTNYQIEQARQSGTPMLGLDIRGYEYVLIFDSGGGASGQPPVLIRPKRYELILTAIEEDIARTNMNLLVQELTKHVPDTRVFFGAFLQNQSRALQQYIPEKHHPVVTQLLNDVRDVGSHVATRIQSLLPALLNKYKECNIRQATNETLRPKRIPKAIRKTLMTGLRVPNGNQLRFSQLIQFVKDKQCWQISGKQLGNSRCDICQTTNVVLGHCGSAVACLKCWVDSLSTTSMSCPFCRTEVKDKQLITVQPQLPETSRKRKRQLVMSEQEIMKKITSTSMYENIRLDDEGSMRKWLTVLLRSGVLQNGQLPRDLKSKKSLRGALQELNILS